MKKLLLLITILYFAISCNEQKQQTEKSSVSEEKPYSWEDYPNENTKTKIINTRTTIDDKELIARLEKSFKKDKFKIESEINGGGNSYGNCNDNLTLEIKGNGTKHYFVKRTEAKPKNYYPDFSMSVYEFETEEETVAAENEIKKAFSSWNGFCNGKSPNYIVRYKNQIVHLHTRAEMFRGYIKDYAEKIRTY